MASLARHGSVHVEPVVGSTVTQDRVLKVLGNALERIRRSERAQNEAQARAIAAEQSLEQLRDRFAREMGELQAKYDALESSATKDRRRAAEHLRAVAESLADAEKELAAARRERGFVSSATQQTRGDTNRVTVMLSRSAPALAAWLRAGSWRKSEDSPVQAKATSA